MYYIYCIHYFYYYYISSTSDHTLPHTNNSTLDAVGISLACDSGWCTAKSCPTLCDPMDYSPPGSSVCGILQARIMEWFALPSSWGSTWSRDQTCVCCVSCASRGILYHYKPLNANILDNLHEMDKFLEIHNLSRLNYEEIENLNGPTAKWRRQNCETPGR